MKNTLGPVIQDRREAIGMTQRGLARAVGVKPSHIGYLEHGRRRPSLSLVARLADVLGLEKQRLFLLAHPEAKDLVDDGRAARAKKGPWDQLIRNKGLVRRYKITSAELRVLSQVNMLGKVSHIRDFLYVLQAIRQALSEEASGGG